MAEKLAGTWEVRGLLMELTELVEVCFSEQVLLTEHGYDAQT